MPIVTPTDFVEGEAITKSSILATNTAIEEIDFDIDGDNIREEGLDRRAFKDLSLISNPYDSVRLASYQDLPGSDAFDFGLYVIPPAEATPASPVLSHNPHRAGVWPYARTYLSDAFGFDATTGGEGHKGEHDQYDFDKRSKMTQSVTLLYMAKSNSSERFASFIWNKSGTAKVALVYRFRVAGDRPDRVRINGLQLSYQKFRR